MKVQLQGTTTGGSTISLSPVTAISNVSATYTSGFKITGNTIYFAVSTGFSITNNTLTLDPTYFMNNVTTAINMNGTAPVSFPVGTGLFQSSKLYVSMTGANGVYIVGNTIAYSSGSGGGSTISTYSAASAFSSTTTEIAKSTNYGIAAFDSKFFSNHDSGFVRPKFATTTSSGVYKLYNSNFVVNSDGVSAYLLTAANITSLCASGYTEPKTFNIGQACSLISNISAVPNAGIIQLRSNVSDTTYDSYPVNMGVVRSIVRSAQYSAGGAGASTIVTMPDYYSAGDLMSSGTDSTYCPLTYICSKTEYTPVADRFTTSHVFASVYEWCKSNSRGE